MNTPQTAAEVATALLEKNPDGLTIAQLARQAGALYGTMQCAINRSAGHYIDRWTLNSAGTNWVAVYCLGNDEDAPKPGRRAVDQRRMEAVHA
jgi:hypothetical protein